jgi:hypothetical protein
MRTAERSCVASLGKREQTRPSTKKYRLCITLYPKEWDAIMKQIIINDIDQLKDLIVGKKIIDVKKGCTISETNIGIKIIVLEDDLEMELSGVADCVMVYCLWQQ